MFPRFREENMKQNGRLVETLHEMGREHKASGAQLAIAWVLHQGRDIVPLIGSRTRKQLREALGARHVKLSTEESNRIAKAVPAESVAGSRYDERQMAVLDSERAAKATS